MYAKHQGEEREKRVANLKTCLLRREDFFKKATKESDTAVEASYVVSELIAKAGKPLKGGEFVKKCTLLAVSIVCPERRVSLVKSAFQPTQWQSAFLTCQVTYMINCVRKQNVSIRDAPNFRPTKFFGREWPKSTFSVFGRNTFITETTLPKQKFVMTQAKSAAGTRLSG